MLKVDISDDNLLVYRKNYSVDFIRTTIRNRGLDGLFIYDVLDPLASMDFLKDLVFLTHLRLQPVEDHDYSFLRYLTHLKSLYIGDAITNNREIDLSAQTDLVFLGIRWRKHITGLENCGKLEKILLMAFNEPDLSVIRKVPTLKELWIKTSRVKELTGIESCQNLAAVLLGNCSRLQSVRALNHHPHLREIELELCSKISDFEELTDLPVLEKLRIIDCKIPSIGCVRNLPSLSTVIMTGRTDVLDGDLQPLEKVRDIYYSNRPHYNTRFPPSNWRRYAH